MNKETVIEVLIKIRDFCRDCQGCSDGCSMSPCPFKEAVYPYYWDEEMIFNIADDMFFNIEDEMF